MLKKLLMIGICLITLPAMAITCEEGIAFQGDDGTDMCVSKITMNWWSAFSWCRANGLRLASHAQACAGNAPASSCINVYNKTGLQGNAWTSNTHGKAQAWAVFLSSQLWSQSPGKAGKYYALCVE